MNPVDKVNKLSKSDFISTFGNVFEKTTCIAEKVFNFKPFGNFENLSEKFLIIFENENEKNCLKIFNAHPELAIKKIMTTDSRKEQSNAKLNQCTEEELKEFIELNKDYKNKFGFPFIIAVKGKNKSEILFTTLLYLITTVCAFQNSNFSKINLAKSFKKIIKKT